MSDTLVRWECPACGLDLSGKSYNIDESRKKCSKLWHQAMAVKREYALVRPPAIALRRKGGPTVDDSRLDDVVVTHVTMFRAEILDENLLWLCCYLTNGERITWQVEGEGLGYEVVEMPEKAESFDGESKAA